MKYKFLIIRRDEDSFFFVPCKTTIKEEKVLETVAQQFYPIDVGMYWDEAFRKVTQARLCLEVVTYAKLNDQPFWKLDEYVCEHISATSVDKTRGRWELGFSEEEVQHSFRENLQKMASRLGWYTVRPA